MHKSLFLVSIILTITTLSSAQKKYIYPVAPKDSTTNTYFDSTISDPYQWMENPNDPRLIEWLEAEKKITKKQSNHQYNKDELRAQIASMYLDIKEKKNSIYEENKHKKLDKYEFETEYSSYSHVPDLLYRKRGTTNYKYLVKIKDFCKGKDENVIITNKIMNHKQDIIAIEMSRNGSDWREVYFFNLETGKQIPDTLKYLRISSKIIWNDNGVYYDKYNKPLEGRELLDKVNGQTLFYHKIGTAQTEDLKIYQNPDTSGQYSFYYYVMDSTKLFFNNIVKLKSKMYRALSYANIQSDKSFFLKNFLVYPYNDSTEFNIKELFGDTVILSTTWNSPNGRVIKVNINQLNKMEEFIPELDATLRDVKRLGKDKIVCTYRKDGQILILIYNLKGELVRKIDFPTGKDVEYLYEDNTNAEYTDFCVSSFFHPDIWYQLSLKDLNYYQSETVWVPYDVNKLETRYVKYKSKDGTEIPMYITCLKQTKLDGSNPTILQGYGGYGITIEPYFDESIATWLIHGGILAIPNIRGGGSEGSEWANAGKRLKKQNTIDDFIAAAEYLEKEEYTNPNKLAIVGGSHGGMLVGAAITQRPELFKVAIAQAGAFDMLRFENFTVGTKNIDEFGTVKNYDDFCNLKSYSPLHNIKSGITYPNVLLITGDNDDRVPPLHSYKFIATLQEKGNHESLYQLYIIPKSSHLGALTPKDWLDKLLFKYYFLFDELDLRFL